MKRLGKIFIFLISLGFLGALAGILLIGAVLYKYGQALPEYETLRDYQPPVVTRVHAADGRFFAEFAQERRIFVPISEIPDRVKFAFMSAEDQNFYEHKGVDVTAIARAVFINLKNVGMGRRPVGASTITQQVAKNFLLTNEVSYERKIREAILAYKLEESLTKDRILELYLNQIFLGYRSYGVAAAGLVYFNKPLNELSIAEAAFLGALPKAPNNYNPITHHEEALARRNWVIDRMAEDGHIKKSEAELAKQTPLEIVTTKDSDVVDAPYFAEEVRRELKAAYGDDGVYRGGLSVRTSLNPQYQAVAEKALQNGLMAYDRKKGWRGPLQSVDSTSDWQTTLKKIPTPIGTLQSWSLAMVLGTGSGDVINIGLKDGTRARLDPEDKKWVANSPLKTGDVILVEKDAPENQAKSETLTCHLRQVPQIQGALIALDPNTGRVLAMQGGWKFDGSEFNRATQAQRQPGSAFKPFIYLAALDKGYTPSSMILDAPIVFTDTAGNVWKPENYSGEFYGPTPLRVGVEKSRNLMTIRLAQEIGMDTVVNYAQRFGISDDMQPFLSNALGADETTLLKLTAAYGMIVNGGKKITPSFIDRVQDRYGETSAVTDVRPCTGCGPLIKWENQETPDIPDTRQAIADPRTAYQMVSILEGVVQRGTAKSLASLDRPLAGKTGTTNDSKDVWFIGFTPDLVVGVFAGYDDPITLGKKETGGSLAVPIFKEFIEKALKDVPPTPFRIPSGVRMMQVNAESGQPTYSTDPDAIWEPFVAGTEPETSPAIYGTTGYTNENGTSSETPATGYSDQPLPADEMLTPNPDDSNAIQGTGGIY